jgi:FtsH-binding integral membrane protein
MENLLQIVSVPVITTVVYGALALYKYVVNGKESLIRLIPVIAVALGVVLGITAFFATPDIIAADNVFTAILIGGASGLAATGTNQIFKQLTKGKEDETDDGSEKR